MQKHLTDGLAAPVCGEPGFQVGLAEDALACAQAGLGPRWDSEEVRGWRWPRRPPPCILCLSDADRAPLVHRGEVRKEEVVNVAKPYMDLLLWLEDSLQNVQPTVVP